MDLSPREIAVFAPLVVLTLWMGIYPSSFTGFFDASVAAMVQHHAQAMAAPVANPTGAAPAAVVKLAQVLH
jgi:NADH-quinone oxidoreductase subunit M